MQCHHSLLNKPPCLLLVESHPALAFSWKSMLERIGFHVVLACNEERALMLARNRPDLIVLPIDEISLDGLKLCRCLRAEGLTIPILGLVSDMLKDIAPAACQEVKITDYHVHCHNQPMNEENWLKWLLNWLPAEKVTAILQQRRNRFTCHE